MFYFSIDLNTLPAGLYTKAGYDRGRANRGAAAALLGKLYMNREKYSLAAAEFRKILPGAGDAAYGTYTLTNNYRDNFNRTTENNSESIFEVQFTNMNSQGVWSKNDVPWVFQNFTLNRTSWSIMWWNFAVPNFKLNRYESWTENISGTPPYTTTGFMILSGEFQAGQIPQIRTALQKTGRNRDGPQKQ